MSVRRPTAPPSGDRDPGARRTGPGAAVGAGAPRRPAVPRTIAPAVGAPRKVAPVVGAPRSSVPRPGPARSSAHRPAPSRPASRPTATATSSGSRGMGVTDRGPVTGSRLPRLFSVRALVLFVVGLLAFVLLFPTVRAYLAQRADNDRLVQHVAEARAANDDLTAELKRWTDDAYVAAQARERLAFVLPGETAFRVVDPETVPDPTAPTLNATGSGPALVAEGTTTPWYATIWASVRVAGEAEVATAPTGAPTGSPTGDATTPPATEPGTTPSAPATP